MNFLFVRHETFNAHDSNKHMLFFALGIDNRRQPKEIYRYWWTVVLVTREHNIYGVGGRWNREAWHRETWQSGTRLNRSQRVEHPSAQE